MHHTFFQHIDGNSGSDDNSNLDALVQLVQRQTAIDDYPLASAIVKNVVVYEAEQLNQCIERNEIVQLKSELNYCLNQGPGVFAVKGLQPNTQLIEATNQCFDAIIEQEEQKYKDRSDHFSSGANSRIWNSFEKLCNHSPQDFVQYFANPLLDLICQSWLGPYYQMTTQLNVVRPGGKAQVVHRDYHMGFQTQENLSRFPISAHNTSCYLTLQGAIAHSNVPIESGSTQLLPYSQLLESGYLAVYEKSYRDYFNEHRIQLDLEMGDALFFNPALFHAAGDNTTDNINRSVNLMQVVSPFSRAMERINRKNMIKSIYPHLAELQQSPSSLTPAQSDAIVHAVAEGYPFPTNLDDNPPVSNAMTSDQDITKQALATHLSAELFNQQIDSNI